MLCDSLKELHLLPNTYNEQYNLVCMNVSMSKHTNCLPSTNHYAMSWECKDAQQNQRRHWGEKSHIAKTQFL